MFQYSMRLNLTFSFSDGIPRNVSMFITIIILLNIYFVGFMLSLSTGVHLDLEIKESMFVEWKM